jgi:hypothetical protein
MARRSHDLLVDEHAVQRQLRLALRVNGERESGTARLEEAVAAYRDALQERTRERVPLEWAMSTGNQGVALMLLAERRRDAEMAKLAVQQIEAAFTTSPSPHLERKEGESEFAQTVDRTKKHVKHFGTIDPQNV